jgi:hypothetical protein
VKIDTVKGVGSILTAWLMIGGCFWFLNTIVRSLADPDQAQIPEGQLGIIIGGMIAILTMAAQSVFQAEATRSAARSQQAAYDKGLVTPSNGQTAPNVVVTPPADATTSTTVTSEPPVEPAPVSEPGD